MADIRIVPFGIKDALTMAEQIRPVDRFECQAMMQGVSLPEAMLHMQKISEMACAAYIDGELLCCWGRIRHTVLSNECCPWMVATPLIENKEARRIFILKSPAISRQLTKGFSRSWNIVLEDNKIAIRWLEWIGFEFVGKPVLINGYNFLPFEKRRKKNVL